MSKAMGIEGESIMFSSNETPASEYEYANKIGAIINLDDFTHIDFLEKTLGSLPETLSLRYNPGGVFKISTSIMDNPGDAKYGLTTEQLFEGYRVLKEKGVKRFGMHAFLASNTVTNEYYPTLAKTLFETAVRIKEQVGVSLEENIIDSPSIPMALDNISSVWEEQYVPQPYSRKISIKKGLGVAFTAKKFPISGIPGKSFF